MRVLIFGKTGQVGTELRRLFLDQSDVLALGKDDEGGDLTNLNTLKYCIKKFQPDVVFNAAAFTKVDVAETQRSLAHLINVDAVREIAIACSDVGSLLVHYSTDYIFDGDGESYIKEDVEPHPINYYGYTKYLGEKETWRASAIRNIGNKPDRKSVV